MQEPILEALTFKYGGINISEENDGEITTNDNVQHRDGQGSSSTVTERDSPITQQLNKALLEFKAVTTTPCPFPSCHFQVDGLTDPLCENFTITQEFLKHLLIEHQLVIDNVASIANLHRYLLYWGKVFARSDFQIENVCVAFWMDKPMISADHIEKEKLKMESDSQEQSETRFKYYMLTDVVPEDKDLRSRLWSERLESVLEINRLERDQTDFTFKCPLFCKEICVGNRANLFLHMAQEHGFHVGQPDNIVFVNDFLALIESQLESLMCIYCEKTFKDRVTLKEHMRKKMHKRINPLNPEYDRFYMVNYLEVGKTWQALEQEDVDEERVEEDWKEFNDEANQIVCLICPKQHSSFEKALNHMINEHNFDFSKIASKHNFYQKVKIVNFVRRNIYQGLCFYCDLKITDEKEFITHINHHSVEEFPQKKAWDQAELLFPTYENDQFLMFISDDDENTTGEKMDTDMTSSENPTIIPEDLSDIKVPPIIKPPPDLDLDMF